MDNVSINIGKNEIIITINDTIYFVERINPIQPYLQLRMNINPWGFNKETKRLKFGVIGCSEFRRYIQLYDAGGIIDTNEVISEDDKKINTYILDKLCKYFGIEQSMIGILVAVINQHLNGELINLTKALHTVLPILRINYFEFLEQTKKSNNHKIMESLQLKLLDICLHNIDYKIFKPVTNITTTNSVLFHNRLLQVFSNLSDIPNTLGSIDWFWSEKRIIQEYDRIIKTYALNGIEDLKLRYNSIVLQPIINKGFTVLDSVLSICEFGLVTGNCLFKYDKYNCLTIHNGESYPNCLLIHKDGVVYKISIDFVFNSCTVTEYKKSFNRPVNEMDCYYNELKEFFKTIKPLDVALPTIKAFEETMV